jgi:hypothetical protein
MDLVYDDLTLEFSVEGRQNMATLPRLTPLDKGEIYAWMRHPKVQRRIEGHECSIRELVRTGRQLQMERFAEAITELA